MKITSKACSFTALFFITLCASLVARSINRIPVDRNWIFQFKAGLVCLAISILCVFTYAFLSAITAANNGWWHRGKHDSPTSPPPLDPPETYTGPTTNTDFGVHDGKHRS